MSNTLIRMLKLSPEEKKGLEKTLGRIKTVNEFLADAVEGFKDTDFHKAIAQALPWVGAIGGAVIDAVPPIKFLTKLFDRLTTVSDPEALALLACTTAYQQAIEQAVREVGAPRVPSKVKRDLRDALKSPSDIEPHDFTQFSFGSALSHSFMKQSDCMLQSYAHAVGYDADQCLRLVGQVHTRFVVDLKTLLSSGGLKEKFAPFTQYITFGTAEGQAYHALLEHSDYQRWLFEERAVFGREPFALANVYVEAECGLLRWCEIRDGQMVEEGSGGYEGPDEKKGPSRNLRRARSPINPFLESAGGRYPLLNKVLDFLGDPGFRDAIVIQGVAGSGKSSFTLRLCVELVNQGLRPIRVQLRHLQFDRRAAEDIANAIRLTDEMRDPQGLRIQHPTDLFLSGTIFREEVSFRGARICPYILILDGWDEISMSASEGYKQRLVRFLEQVRAEYLQDRADTVTMRVILAGRPSPDLAESLFLKDQTPIMTIRPLKPDQLELLVGKLDRALIERPVRVKSAEFWMINDVDNYREIFDKYRSDFGSLVQPKKRKESPGDLAIPPANAGSLDVLGLPLLAHLAVRLMSQWKGDLVSLIRNPTTLYRSLVELTCQRSGKSSEEHDEAIRTHIKGSQLRDLLRRTAEAMTISGRESIAYEELSQRLNLQGDDLDKRVRETTEDHVLSVLVISFFFKGGHRDLGCEFSHKSFREYLFAERLIEELKKWGRACHSTYPRRATYWTDFRDDDARFGLSRGLATLLAPQWLSHEVTSHLRELLSWELTRSALTNRSSSATERLELEEWNTIRDALADVWEWWVDGGHLRPQPHLTRRGVDFKQAYVHELVDWSAPQFLIDQRLPAPEHFSTIDAHLGDGLFRLCCLVNSVLQPESNVTKFFGYKALERSDRSPSPFQSTIVVDDATRILFTPFGRKGGSSAIIIGRINSAEGRPSGPFPGGANMDRVDLNGVRAKGASYAYSSLSSPLK